MDTISTGCSFMQRPHVVLVGSGSTEGFCPASAQVGAAVLGVPVKPTIKEVDGEGRVTKTLVRAGLWEVQTPQVRHRGSHVSAERTFSGYQMTPGMQSATCCAGPPLFVTCTADQMRQQEQALHCAHQGAES